MQIGSCHKKRLLYDGKIRGADCAGLLVDIAAIKSVISNIADDSPIALTLCSSLIDQILEALSKGDAEDSVVLEMLDVMHDIFLRFGKILQTQHAQAQETLLKHLSHARMAVRKRTVTALGCLVGLTTDELFKGLMDFILANVGNAGSGIDPRTMVQLATNVSKEAGDRFSPYLAQVLPPITALMSNEDDDDELRDSCIQAFKSFALRCQKDVGDHLEQLVAICLEYLQYDPNYNYDSDEDEDEEMESEDDEDSDGDFSDDDDVSWKVRRSAANFFTSIIKTRPMLLPTLLDSVAPVLVKQFREREEGVRTEVYLTYRALLQQARSITPKTAAIDPKLLALITKNVGQIVKTLVKQSTELCKSFSFMPPASASVVLTPYLAVKRWFEYFLFFICARLWASLSIVSPARLSKAFFTCADISPQFTQLRGSRFSSPDIIPQIKPVSIMSQRSLWMSSFSAIQL